MSLVTVLVVTCEHCGKEESRSAPYPREPSIGTDDGWLVLEGIDVNRLLRTGMAHWFAWCSEGCLRAWFEANAFEGSMLTVQTGFVDLVVSKGDGR